MLTISNSFNSNYINNVVFGGAGFLGSHLIDHLLRIGENVLCIDNLSTGSLNNISHLLNNDNFFFIRHDILNPIDSNIPIDKIWHLACPASPRFYQVDPINTLRINYEGTSNISN